MGNTVRKARTAKQNDSYIGIVLKYGKGEFFRCKVMTCKKKFRSKVKAMKEWIKYNRAMPVGEMIKKKIRS